VETKAALGKELVYVTVTEVVDASTLYVQIKSPAVDSLDLMMKKLSVAASGPTTSPKVGELVCAQFSQDNQWYRGRIRRILPGKTYEVFYMDYGNVGARLPFTVTY
jgi:staphylococcal nuclease domain-containing protein 1